MKQKKYKAKTSLKIIIISFLILFLCGGISLIYYGFNQENKNVQTYSYNESESIDYKVYLKENTFYAENYLEMDRQYPSNLTDYIEIELGYNYNGSRLYNTNYEYSVDATIIGEYESAGTAKTEIWKKVNNIEPLTAIENNNTTSTNLKKKIVIDYGKYNLDVAEYRNNFRLAIDAYLDVTLKIKYSVNIIDSEIVHEDTKTITLKIPLTTSTFKITTYKDDNKSDTLTSTEIITRNYYIVTSGAILVLMSIITLYIFYVKCLKVTKSEYRKKIDKLLHDYSEIIVEVSTPIEIDEDIRIIDIKTFDDMVDIEEEIKSPIMLYEIKKNKETWFVIMNDEHLYRYIVN